MTLTRNFALSLRLSYDYTNKKLHLVYPDMHGDMYRILIDFSKVVFVWHNGLQ